jgi:hypothetical protein
MRYGAGRGINGVILTITLGTGVGAVHGWLTLLSLLRITGLPRNWAIPAMHKCELPIQTH